MSLAKGSVAEQVSRPLAPAVALRTVFKHGRPSRTRLGAHPFSTVGRCLDGLSFLGA